MARRSPSGQLSLLGGAAPEANPRAPRAERMGSVEARHWPVPTPAGPWTLEPTAWRGPSGASLPLLVGVDEAGRGPLAGPVSVAAVLFNPETLAAEEHASWVGKLDDSKKLSEAVRARLFEAITAHAAAWSIVHVHADHIDEVNILQATWHGMCLAVEQVLGLEDEPWPRCPEPWRLSAAGEETPQACWYAEAMAPEDPPLGVDLLTRPPALRCASARVLIDGNQPYKVEGASASRLTRLPVVKGDALSHHIAAASVLAKVSRDEAMGRLEELWPGYGMGSHKGYPTAEHRAAVHTLGPSPVHRRSFKVSPP